jgi:hypothetical protein
MFNFFPHLFNMRFFVINNEKLLLLWIKIHLRSQKKTHSIIYDFFINLFNYENIEKIKNKILSSAVLKN